AWTSAQSVSSSSRRAKWRCASAGASAGTSVTGKRVGKIGMGPPFALQHGLGGAPAPLADLPCFDNTLPMVPRQRRVAVLAYDGLCTFEFALAVEVFGLPRPELEVPWYQFAVCAAERGPLRATGGVTVQAPGGLALLERAGTIVIPGWRDLDAPPPRALLAALRSA